MLNAKKAVHQTLLLIENGFKKNEWDYSATFHRRSKRLNGYWSKMKTTDRPTVFQTPMHKRKETRTRMRTRLTQFIIGRMQFMSFICSFVRKTSHNFKCDEKNLDIARSRCDQYGWSVYWWNWFLWSFSGRSCWYCFHISIYIQMRSSANDPLRPASAWKVAAAISRAD